MVVFLVWQAFKMCTDNRSGYQPFLLAVSPEQLMAFAACKQGGNISALIAMHPDHRCGTLCGDLATPTDPCHMPDQDLVRLTGLRAATLSAVQECVGKSLPLKLVESANFTDNQIRATANNGQSQVQGGGACIGGGFLVTFPAECLAPVTGAFTGMDDWCHSQMQGLEQSDVYKASKLCSSAPTCIFRPPPSGPFGAALHLGGSGFYQNAYF
jgi:hypothetical protein